MLSVVFIIFCIFLGFISPVFAMQNYTTLTSIQNPILNHFNALSTDYEGESESPALPIIYRNIISSDYPKMQHTKFISDNNKIKYDLMYFSDDKESRRTIYYSTPFKVKGFLSRLLLGDHFSARMDTFKNSEIPFLERGSGVATEISTKSTNLSASYFKSDTKNNGNNNAINTYQSENKSLTSDTKFSLAVPYLPKLKLFGGYSYSRNIESRLTRGPSFGFQAAVLEYVKVDTTFVKQRVGKTATKVLFSLNMPLDKLKF